MMRIVAFVIVALVFVSCRTQTAPSPKPYFNFDSLLDNQIEKLTLLEAFVEKQAYVDGKTDQSVYKPDSADWANELAMFRELGVINKPANLNAYDVLADAPDKHSNLLTRTLTARGDAEVQRLVFYYDKTPEQLRKIEAEVVEMTSLYDTSRKLQLTFDNHDGELLLVGYAIEGIQKIILNDSVRFSIHAQVIFQN